MSSKAVLVQVWSTDQQASHPCPLGGQADCPPLDRQGGPRSLLLIGFPDDSCTVKFKSGCVRHSCGLSTRVVQVPSDRWMCTLLPTHLPSAHPCRDLPPAPAHKGFSTDLFRGRVFSGEFGLHPQPSSSVLSCFSWQASALLFRDFSYIFTSLTPAVVYESLLFIVVTIIGSIVLALLLLCGVSVSTPITRTGIWPQCILLT